MNNRKKIVFATNNAHKLAEVRSIVDGSTQILSLADIGCDVDIPETADTLQGNAVMKARFIKDNYGYDCFADDTGLLVDALNGEPGVYSARYAGEAHDSAANMRKLLENLEGIENRKAHFSTVIALIEGEKLSIFEGAVYGEIITEPEGEGGFGYDPVFRPEGSDVTFASMSGEAKNAISHRGIATRKLIDYLYENS